MKLPKAGTDARKIRESLDLSQADFAEQFGAPFRESITKIEARAKLTWMQCWFYYFLSKHGLPKE